MNSFSEILFAFVLIAGIIGGIRLMSSPRTAVKGNLLGATCILGGIVLTLISEGIITYKILWLAMAVGAASGYLLAANVAMIRMPELVALFNGLGGGASAFVALLILLGRQPGLSTVSIFASGLALTTGAFTLSGSLVAAGKLARKLPQRPIMIKGHTALILAAATAAGVLIILAATAQAKPAPIAVVMLLVALSLGVLFAVRIGGADMPITISLLNSLSGLAASIAGFALRNPLLVAVGAIVGAAGLILTRIMCRAMNRNLLPVITGRTILANGGEALQEDNTDETSGKQPQQAPEKKPISLLLKSAETVVIVPGYGMAVAQAQFQVKNLLDAFQKRGADVRFAIHPVAGRMPGHMHVLLAEAGVPYDILCEMDEINPQFPQTDLGIVIGANDVVNTAASTAEGTPIYGMPILDVGSAKQVIVCNVDDKPGYAGVANPLYNQDNVALLVGDAKETVADLVSQLALLPT